ncbi:MAG: twin-arginine translocase TatA/TatE family subunit [Planctomycetaceae bacterium]|nr:twin-arginine translocase TatA/TatE family subunit [Planctomycetaceae bacterium]
MPTMLAVMSATHVILVVVVVLLLFGSQKIPELMRSVGSGLNEFKKGMREGEQALLREPEATAKETSPRPE